MFILKLKPWDERTAKEDHVQSVIGQVYGRTADIKDASIFAMAPGMIPGYGMGNALEMYMQDKREAISPSSSIPPSNIWPPCANVRRLRLLIRPSLSTIRNGR